MSFQYIKNTYHRNLSEFFLFENREKIHGSILDAGSGARRYDHLFEGNVVSFDIVPNAQNNVVFGNLDERLPFEDNSFDSFICIEVLQYTINFRNAIFELARVLRTGGEGIVVVPHYYPEHGENFHFSSRCITSELQKAFTEVQTIPYGNFYTVCYDSIRLKIRTIKWVPLRRVGFTLWSVVAVFLHIFLKETKTDDFYSGTFLRVKK